jgi:hypothetical protein
VNFESGNDSATCGDSPETACKLFNSDDGALAKVEAQRSIIVMAPLVHEETAAIDGGSVGTSLTIIAEGATLQAEEGADQMALFVTDEARVTLIGGTLRGGEGERNGAGVFVQQNSGVSLERVRVTDNESDGVVVLQGCSLRMSNSVVENNSLGGIWAGRADINVSDSQIRSNALRGVFARSSRTTIRRSLITENRTGGIIATEADIQIENNFIVNNGASPIDTVTPAGGIRIVTNGASTRVLDIRHNTIVNNQAPDSVDAPGILCSTSGQTVTNSNIVYGNTSTLAKPQIAGNCSVDYSNVEGSVVGTGNISTPPTFVSGTDYHLAPGSADINQADPDSPTSTDIDEEPRPSDGRADIGADEV